MRERERKKEGERDGWMDGEREGGREMVMYKSQAFNCHLEKRKNVLVEEYHFF